MRAGNDYLFFANVEGFIQHKKSPRITDLRANATATVDDIALVEAGVVRAHLMNAASKQRLRFSSKPQLSVRLQGRADSSGEDQLGSNTEDQVFPAEFAAGDTFLMRAAIPEWTYSVSVESKDPTISARPGVTAFNVKPGETVEIDLPVDVTKPGGAHDGKP